MNLCLLFLLHLMININFYLFFFDLILKPNNDNIYLIILFYKVEFQNDIILQIYQIIINFL